MPAPSDEERGLLRTLVGDGTPLLLVGAGALALAGVFAIFLALAGEFLPHDIRYLGMSETDLCGVADCRVVDFMVHDRVAFGGALIGLGVLYAYTVLFPLRQGEAWAWWLLVLSVGFGFLSFFAYLGYGYLDTWHGIGTLLLAPPFVVGLWRTRRLVGRLGPPYPLRDRVRDLRTADGLGRACLLVGAAGVALAGAEILRIGVSGVFVPQDLAFMGVTSEQLEELNPRLLPLIAHDRAGFGGAVYTTGFTTAGLVWFGRTTRAWWETLLLAGGVSLFAAIGIHVHVGYVDLWHLLPPMVGAVSLVAGLALTFPTAYGRTDPALE